MVSMYQMEAVAKLQSEGWKIIGPVSSECGSGTIMEDPEGKRFIVNSAGAKTPVEKTETD